MFPTKWSFQLGMGVTSLIGRRPTASELITTAGRVFLISAPTVGSRFTSQTSPRRGGLVLDNVTTLPEFAFLPVGFEFVFSDYCFGLFREYSAPLLDGEFQEGESV